MNRYEQVDWFKPELELLGETTTDPYPSHVVGYRFSQIADIKRMFAFPHGLVCMLVQVGSSFEVRFLDGLQCAADVFSLTQWFQKLSGDTVSPNLTFFEALKVFWDRKGVFYHDDSWYLSGMDYLDDVLYLRSDFARRCSEYRGKKMFDLIASMAKLKVSKRFPALSVCVDYVTHQDSREFAHVHVYHPSLKGDNREGRVSVSLDSGEVEVGDMSALPSQERKDLEAYFNENLGYLRFVWDLFHLKKRYAAEYTGANAGKQLGYKARLDAECKDVSQYFDVG